MADALRLETKKEPTFWNKEMVIGTLIAPGVGTVVGALLGIDRMKKEKAEGKLVSNTPSFWNKDTLLGGLLGSIGGGIVAAVATTAAIGTGLLPAAIAVAQLGIYTGVIGGTVAGGYLGGKSGQEKELQEYKLAHQRKSHVSSNERSQEHSMEHEHVQSKSFVKKLEQERSQQQGHSR